MVDDEVDPATRALANTIADYASAQAGVLTAVLSTLVKAEILSAEQVKTEILDSLSNIAQQNQTQDGEAQALGLLVARIRQQLFPEK